MGTKFNRTTLGAPGAVALLHAGTYLFLAELWADLASPADAANNVPPFGFNPGDAFSRAHAGGFLALTLGYIFLIVYAYERRHRAQRRVVDRSSFDPVTTLPRRVFSEEILNIRLKKAASEAKPLTVLLIDMRGLDRVNQAMGRKAGDELLRGTAARLKDLIGSGDTLGRLESDTFMLLHDGRTDTREFANWMRELRRAFDEPVGVFGADLRVVLDIGAASFPHDGQNAEALLAAAAKSLQRDEGVHRNASRAAPAVDQDTLLLETALPGALRRGEFTAAFQAQYALDAQTLVGAELLVRWNHPRHGLLPPGVFLESAEHLGLLPELTRAMLIEAARQWRKWVSAGGAELRLAINLSHEDLLNPNLLQTVRETTRRYGMPLNRLTLEVLESHAITDAARVQRNLSMLAEAGIRIAIDDFGSGYSSFAQLANIPAHELKIDRSLTRHAAGSSQYVAILRGIEIMARELGLETVMEGIESTKELAIARSVGAKTLQGFLLAKPVLADEFARNHLGLEADTAKDATREAAKRQVEFVPH